jgi:NAD(P)-dependent dehydrogenase (short-subunit alcohol dehydrogenase family)
MELTNKTVLVTGANRGIGEALVRELLKHNVTKVYAGARKTNNLPDFGDKRVVPLALDITNREQITKAVATAGDIQVLINNAGVITYSSVVGGQSEALANDMNVNYFGTLSMMNAFAPVIEKNGGGIIANVVSVVGLASMASIGGYSASKAALFSATQAARAELAPKGILVAGIFPGPIDTDMARDFEMPKASPESTAEAIVQGLIAGQEDIFPDPMSQSVSAVWLSDPKALEKQFASF